MRQIALVALLLTTACVAPLESYRPVTDPAAKAATHYDADLQACYAVAKAAEAEYQQRQEKEMTEKMMAGILIGAVAFSNRKTPGMTAGV